MNCAEALPQFAVLGILCGLLDNQGSEPPFFRSPSAGMAAPDLCVGSCGAIFSHADLPREILHNPLWRAILEGAAD